MNKHLKSAVTAALGADHVAHVSTIPMTSQSGRKELWIDVIYRDFDTGPDADTLRQVIERVGETACMSDPTPVVNFVAEADLMAFAAE